ncbi:hypothetical protein PCE1_001917 [Barthelona sp. PCE]
MRISTELFPLYRPQTVVGTTYDEISGRLFTLSQEGFINVYLPRDNWMKLTTMALVHPSAYSAIHCMLVEDELRLFVSSLDGNIYEIDLLTGRTKHTTVSHSEAVWCLHSFGNILVAGCEDGKVHCFDIVPDVLSLQHTCTIILNSRILTVNSMLFDRRTFIMIGSSDGHVTLFNYEKKSKFASFSVGRFAILSILGVGLHSICCSDAGGFVKFIDVHNTVVFKEFRPVKGPVFKLHFDESSNALYCAQSDGFVTKYLQRDSDWVCSKAKRMQPSELRTISVVDDSICAISNVGRIMIVDMEHFDESLILPRPITINDDRLQFCDDCKFSFIKDNRVVVGKEKEMFGMLQLSQIPHIAKLNPSGTLLFIGSASKNWLFKVRGNPFQFEPITLSGALSSGCVDFEWIDNTRLCLASVTRKVVIVDIQSETEIAFGLLKPIHAARIIHINANKRIVLTVDENRGYNLTNIQTGAIMHSGTFSDHVTSSLLSDDYFYVLLNNFSILQYTIKHFTIMQSHNISDIVPLIKSRVRNAVQGGLFLREFEDIDEQTEEEVKKLVVFCGECLIVVHPRDMENVSLEQLDDELETEKKIQTTKYRERLVFTHMKRMMKESALSALDRVKLTNIVDQNQELRVTIGRFEIMATNSSVLQFINEENMLYQIDWNRVLSNSAPPIYKHKFGE